MAAIKNYTSPSDFVDDIEAQSRIDYDKGEVKAIQVNVATTDTDGFIILFINNPMSYVVGSNQRYAYTLTEFQSLDFTNELPGLSLYLQTNSGSTVAMWDALTQGERDTYESNAQALILNSQFVPQWPDDTQLP